jgi:hypothetical protein
MSADFTDIPFIQQTFFGGLLGSRPSLTINNKERMKKNCNFKTQHSRRLLTPDSFSFLTHRDRREKPKGGQFYSF